MINDSYSLFSQPSTSSKNEMKNEKYKKNEKSSMTKSDQISLMYCMDTESDIMRNIQKEYQTKTEKHNKHFGFLDPLAPKPESVSTPLQESVSKPKVMEMTKDINYNMLKEIQKEKDKQEVENDELIANLLSTFDPYHEKKEEQPNQPSNQPSTQPSTQSSGPPEKPEYKFHETMYYEPLIQTDDLYVKDTNTTDLIDNLVGIDNVNLIFLNNLLHLNKQNLEDHWLVHLISSSKRLPLINNPKSFFYLKPPKNPPNISHLTPNPIKPTESPPKLPRKARLLKEELQRHRKNLQP